MAQRLDVQKVIGGGMRALAVTHQYIANSGLPRTLIDLVYLRVSQINGCAYCINMHTRDLLDAGVTPQKLMLLSAWRETDGLFSMQERAALQWAESVTLISSTAAADADYLAATAQFGEKELADLTLGIGLINAYNRLAISFRRTPNLAD